jgi:hypothetical protein
MRRIYICLIFLIGFGLYSVASDVNKQTAQVVAQGFMKSSNPTFSTSIMDSYEVKDNGDIMFYIINFTEGGWAIISGTESTIPVLGFSYEGSISESSQFTESFEYLLNGYKNQIKKAKKITTPSEKAKSKWNELLKGAKLSLKSYSPGTYLLNTTRGHVKWFQEENNDGGCSPTYNKFSLSGDIDDTDCDDKKPVGCAAVAMGQIMWYWQYPNFSEYNTYDWKIMPPELRNSTDIDSGDEVAKLLRDCGKAAKMNYTSILTDFSWATTNNVNDGFHDYLGYKGTAKIVRTHYPYGNVWNDLIRAEIDAGRPVLIRGDKSDLNDEKHMFVCDGYHPTYADYFHFNFGWGYPGNSYNTSYQYFNDLNPGNHEYNENQQAIIGISPSLSNIASSVNDVTYNSVSDTRNIEARSSVSLPANGKSLNVTNSGSLNLFAGDAIVLKPGFSIQNGGNFKAMTTQNDFSDDCGISIDDANYSNGILSFEPHNANTFEFEVYTAAAQLVFQSAGTIDQTPLDVWDGTGAYVAGYYIAKITFRNNCGELLSDSYNIFSAGKKSISISQGVLTDTEEFELDEECVFDVYPNPSEGCFSIRTNYQNTWKIEIYDTGGHKVYNKNNLSSLNEEFNTIKLAAGIYYIKVTTKEKIFSEKLVIQ